MPARYGLAGIRLRCAMTLLFLVSETTAIQAYMHAHRVTGMLIWPAACFQYAAGICLFLDCRARGLAGGTGAC